MDMFDIHEAKTHLSKLAERASQGETLAIARAGKPMVEVVPYVEPEPTLRSRPGMLVVLIDVHDDFDGSGREESERMVYGDGEG